MKFYYPYPSDRPEKKFFIITNEGKRVYFGQANASDYTIHKDAKRKQLYINRHKKREEHLWNKSGINKPSFWSRFLLWEEPTLELAYKKIREKLKGWGVI